MKRGGNCCSREESPRHNNNSNNSNDIVTIQCLVTEWLLCSSPCNTMFYLQTLGNRFIGAGKHGKLRFQEVKGLAYGPGLDFCLLSPNPASFHHLFPFLCGAQSPCHKKLEMWKYGYHGNSFGVTLNRIAQWKLGCKHWLDQYRKRPQNLYYPVPMMK